jgi:hypothetical protein
MHCRGLVLLFLAIAVDVCEVLARDFDELSNPDDWDEYSIIGQHAHVHRQKIPNAEMREYKKLMNENRVSSKEEIIRPYPTYGHSIIPEVLEKLPWNQPPEDAMHRPIPLDPEPIHPSPAETTLAILSQPEKRDWPDIIVILSLSLSLLLPSLLVLCPFDICFFFFFAGQNKLEVALEFEVENWRDATGTILALESMHKAMQQKSDRDVWTAGAGLRGQTGHQKAEKYTNSFSKVATLDYTVIMQIACGMEHMVAMSGAIFFSYSHIFSLAIKQQFSSSSSFHCLDTGNSYLWGDGSVGQLTDEMVSIRLKPYWTKEFRNQKLKSLVAGGFHSLVIDGSSSLRKPNQTISKKLLPSLTEMLCIL